MRYLYFDFETKSSADIGSCGLYKYMEDPDFELLLLAWCFDDAEVQLIDFTAGETFPEDFLAALTDPDVLKVAHNAQFERNAVRTVLGIEIPAEQVVDTMVLAAECGLPLSLAQVCEALGFGEDKAKMREGSNLIRKFCCPRKPTKTNPNLWLTPADAPEDWETFKAYCVRDVESEREIHRVLRGWMYPQEEVDFYALDSKINERGIRLDLTLAKNALEMDERYKAELTDKAIALTGMDNPSSVAQVKAWLKEQEGVDVPSLNKKSVSGVVEALQTDAAKQFMDIRAELSKTSTRKYEAIMRCACKDEHARGCFQFFGGHTGRFCLTGDHEVLTPNGWVRLNEWQGGRIVVWSPSAKAYSFQKSEAVSFRFDGDLICIADKRCQQKSTPEHKMMTVNRRGDYVEHTMAELYKKRVTIPATAQRNRATAYDVDALRVLIMTQADGHYTDDGDLKFSFTRDRKIERCKHLLRAAEIPFRFTPKDRDGVARFVVLRTQQPVWLRLFRDKVFGWWMLDENPTAILDEIELWDGTRCGPNSIQYTSTTEQNVDVLQAVCQLAGLSSTKIVKRRDAEHPNWSDAYILNIWLKPSATHEIRGERMTKQEYHGYVYCATTPTGYFMVRRNGVVWITGNSGRLIQLQNLPQNHMEDLDDAREIVRDGDYEFLRAVYPSVTNTLSELIRTTLIPEEGHKFCVADFSAIECRVSAWLCNESWVLKAFEDGQDIYCATASQMFRVPVVKNGENGELRQKGKIATLACGYGGGVGALKAFGADRMGLSPEEMAGIIDTWRAANPHIVMAWKSLGNAAIRCITHQGTFIDKVCGIRFRWDKGVMWMRLPSGREMAYYHPQYGPSEFNPQEMVISYMGVHQQKRKWLRIETRGSRILENLVQATSRDILREAMFALDRDGWDIRAHVHDEVICTEPLTGRSADDMARTMCPSIPWAAGLPLKAEGYECSSYRKE